jgi:enoyl-CoA hydratase/carnithine racemase
MTKLPQMTSLRLTRQGSRIEIELDHGRTNEMGSAQLRDWEALCVALEDPNGGVRSLLTWSRRRTDKGTPIFIAGADVTERTDWPNEKVQAHVRWQRSVLARLRRAPIFHVAVVSGVALGWGTEFLLTCDYRLATPDAAFGLPETGIGIVPGAGGTSELWSYIGVAQALRLGMTGERIGAAEAARIGLIEELGNDLDSALLRARTLCDMVETRSPSAVAAFKAGVLASVGQDPITRGKVEARAYDHCVAGGDPEVGRSSFKAITAGQPVAWPPLRRFTP